MLVIILFYIAGKFSGLHDKLDALRIDIKDNEKLRREANSAMHEHVRCTEKAVYQLADQQSKWEHYHGSDPTTNEQIKALQEEFKLMRNVLDDILAHKPKNMVKECSTTRESKAPYKKL